MATKQLDGWSPADPIKNGRIPEWEASKAKANWDAAMTKKGEVLAVTVLKTRTTSQSITPEQQQHVISEFRAIMRETGNASWAIGPILGLSKSYVPNCLNGSQKPGIKAFDAVNKYRFASKSTERHTDMDALLDLLDQQDKRLHGIVMSLNRQADNLSKAVRQIKELENTCHAQEEAINELLGRTSVQQVVAPRPWWKFWGR